MKTLIIDNYDSFTYNLYQLAGEVLIEAGLNPTVEVVRNDTIACSQIRQRNYKRIIISPGPGDPSDKAYFGICGEAITTLSPDIPILGICLGLQGIAHFFGGKVVRAKKPLHGKVSLIKHDGQGIFSHLPQNLEVMRYHSLIASRVTLPDCLKISATSVDSDEIMGLRHKKYPTEGIQFHPESFATEGGKTMLKNFLLNQGSI